MLAILIHDRVRVAREKLGNDQLRPQRDSEKNQSNKETQQRHRGWQRGLTHSSPDKPSLQWAVGESLVTNRSSENWKKRRVIAAQVTGPVVTPDKTNSRNPYEQRNQCCVSFFSMRPETLPSNSHATDPVATVIETYLRSAERRGCSELKASPEAGGIRLSFANSTARAETYDIALLRLAGELLDDTNYKGGLMSALQSQEAVAAANAQGFERARPRGLCNQRKANYFHHEARPLTGALLKVV